MTQSAANPEQQRNNHNDTGQNRDQCITQNMAEENHGLRQALARAVRTLILANLFQKNCAIPTRRGADTRDNTNQYWQNQNRHASSPSPKPEIGTSRQTLLMWVLPADDVKTSQRSTSWPAHSTTPQKSKAVALKNANKQREGHGDQQTQNKRR